MFHIDLYIPQMWVVNFLIVTLFIFLLIRIFPFLEFWYTVWGIRINSYFHVRSQESRDMEKRIAKILEKKFKLMGNKYVRCLCAGYLLDDTGKYNRCRCNKEMPPSYLVDCVDCRPHNDRVIVPFTD